jgi:hypothetical protein
MYATARGLNGSAHQKSLWSSKGKEGIRRSFECFSSRHSEVRVLPPHLAHSVNEAFDVPDEGRNVVGLLKQGAVLDLLVHQAAALRHAFFTPHLGVGSRLRGAYACVSLILRHREAG